VSLSYIRRGLLSVALAAWAGAGCVAPTGEEPSEKTGSDLARSPDLFTNDQACYDYFVGKGLKNFQAAGIVGNLDQESGTDPTAVQAGGPGRGIAQWSVGGRWDTDANDNAVAYATQQNQSVWSLNLQLDFIWYELTNFSSYGLAALQATTNVSDATVAFQNDFEGCGTCDQSTRISYAQAVLAAYGNDVVDGGGTLPDSGGATPCTVPGVGMGVCITTTQCASMAGYMSTPNYCSGAADIQCCTGPSMPPDSGSSGSGSSSGVGSGSGSGSDSGSSGSSSGGASNSSSGGSSSGVNTDAGLGQDAGGEGTAASGQNYDPSSGCSASPGRGGGSPALAVAGFAWLVVRRRRKA